MAQERGATGGPDGRRHHAAAVRTEQVIAVTLDQLARVLPFDRVTFWRRAGSNGLWMVAATQGATAKRDDDSSRVGRTIKLDAPQHSPLAEVYTSRGLLAIADTSLDRRFDGANDRPASWLGVPLVHLGEVQGLLALEKDTPNAYAAYLMPLAQAFNQAARRWPTALYEAGAQRCMSSTGGRGGEPATSAHASLNRDEIINLVLAALTEALPVSERALSCWMRQSRAGGPCRPLYPVDQPRPAGGLAGSRCSHMDEALQPMPCSQWPRAWLSADQYAWVGTGLQAALFRLWSWRAGS
jgi:hypothetical protein